MNRAVREQRIVVTNDKDFGELIFRSGKAHQGVVLLRLHNESAANRVKMMKNVLEHYADRLAGHFTIATERNVRIRRP